MSARTHPRHHGPAAVGGDPGAASGGTAPRPAVRARPRSVGTALTSGVGTAPSGVEPGPRSADTGLRWWAVVLPVLAFFALLLLVTGASEAQAAAAHSPVTFLGWIQLALTGS
ncbi:hypothetical protein [Streptomyces sp. NPDC019208]|uniref:hypothetical protein n=1 Tax=unclassified Streptomyces TaxID=2593676 RepID=UPI00340DCFE3